jgi:hypothetical protein
VRPDRLGEIDRELDALGKGDGDIAGVIARARAIGREVNDLEAELAALARTTTVRELPTGLYAKRPASAPNEAREPSSPPPSEARAPYSSPPPALVEDEPPTGLVDRPSSEPLSPFDDFTSDPPPESVSEPPPGGADIAGLSVDDLFADAEPTGMSMAPTAGALADLFTSDDASLARSSEPDVGGLEAMLEPGLGDATGPDPFGELEEEHTNIVAPPIGPPGREPTGDFELLIDDDVLSVDDLVLEDEESAGEETPPDDEGGPEKKRGLFSRLLGRK